MKFSLWQVQTNSQEWELLNTEDVKEKFFPLISEISWILQMQPLSFKLADCSFELFFVANPEQVRAFRKLFIPRFVELLINDFPEGVPAFSYDTGPFKDEGRVDEINSTELRYEETDLSAALRKIYNLECELSDTPLMPDYLATINPT